MTGRKGEERSTLVDDPASKEPLHARHEGVSNQPSYLLHRHLHPLSRRPGAGSDTQPIVGPRLITTLPNVRPSHRGRVRHGGPRVPRSLVTYSGAVIRSRSRRSAIVRRFRLSVPFRPSSLDFIPNLGARISPFCLQL